MDNGGNRIHAIKFADDRAYINILMSSLKILIQLSGGFQTIRYQRTAVPYQHRKTWYAVLEKWYKFQITKETKCTYGLYLPLRKFDSKTKRKPISV